MIDDARLQGFFTTRDGELAIGGRTAGDLIAEAGGTPLFVYDSGIVRAKIAGLRRDMPSDLHIHYAVKANPFAPLLEQIRPLVDGFDVASGGELSMALAAGMDPARISFAGPGKRDSELAEAISAGITLNVESEGELSRALKIARKHDRSLKAAIRVNPPFDLKGSGMRMGGGAKPFGIDAERVPDAVRMLVEGGGDFRGFHIFAGSQNLSAEAIIEAQTQTVALAASLAAAAGISPPHVNLGGGFGVPYFPGEEALNTAAIGARLGETLSARPDILQSTDFAIELGRFLVAEAGVYLSQVVDKKVSQETTFVITNGGLHHQLAASGNFGTVIRRNYPIMNATRADASEGEEVDVHGCLCTPLDRLGTKVSLPVTKVGDVIALFMAGAYGRTASPEQFLGHPPPRELLV